MNSGRSVRGRMLVVFVVIVLLFAYIAFCLYHVQVARNDELYGKARKKYTTIRKTAGNRGEILDRDGHLLVGNIPCSNVCADPSLIKTEEDCRKIAVYLAPRIDVDVKVIYDKLMDKEIRVKTDDGKEIIRPRKYVVLKKEMEFEAAEQLRKETEEFGWKGIFYPETTRRDYPKKQLLSNILGFTTSDRDQMIAVVGLEKFYDKKMQSVEGKTVYERSRDGVPLTYGDKQEQYVRDGLNIYLTISEPIQSIVEDELDKLYAAYSPKICYAVMADPETGAILAAAQRPTFDPGDRRNVTPDVYRNRIAEDTFEPGSTMKPLAVAGALDAGVVRPETRFDCEGGHWVYAGKRLKDSHEMGLITVSDIIQQSSNIGTAKIALEMGPERLDAILRAFGIGQRTGIPLKPETRGIYRPLAKWDALSITRFPIGQGLAVSPLQLVRAYCMLANGGHPVKLNLVDRIEDPLTGAVEHVDMTKGPSVYKRPETHQEIVNIMKRVTAPGGTATIAAVKGYHVAGKTGTAQKFVDGVYSKSKYIANFIGFVPADKPRFVLLVSCDEPHGKSYYGGRVSGPYFRSIAERTLKYLEVPYDYDPDLDQKTNKKK